MCSRSGANTISGYLCFKSGYTKEEMKQTGLKQVVDEETYLLQQQKDPYVHVKNKVESNSTTTDAKGAFPQSQKITAIRDNIAKQKDLDARMNRWPGQGYEYVENVLFEKGPFGPKKKAAQMTAIQ